MNLAGRDWHTAGDFEGCIDNSISAPSERERPDKRTPTDEDKWRNKGSEACVVELQAIYDDVFPQWDGAMDGSFPYRNAVNKLYECLKHFVWKQDELVEHFGCWDRLVALLSGVQHWTGRLKGPDALPRQEGAKYFDEIKSLVKDFPIEAVKSREKWAES